MGIVEQHAAQRGEFGRLGFLEILGVRVNGALDFFPGADELANFAAAQPFELVQHVVIHQACANDDQRAADFVDRDELVFEVHAFRKGIQDVGADGELAGGNEGQIELLNDGRGDDFLGNEAELDECFAQKEVALALFFKRCAQLIVGQQTFGSEQFAQPPFGHSRDSCHVSPRLLAA